MASTLNAICFYDMKNSASKLPKYYKTFDLP